MHLSIFSRMGPQAVHLSFVNPDPRPSDGWLWSWSVMLRARHRYWTTSFWFHTKTAEVTHQSILTIPTGPGNSGDIDFSLCKARVYAWHCGDSLMPGQTTAQIPAVKCEITSASLGMECWGQNLPLKRRISFGRGTLFYYWATYHFRTGLSPARDKIFIQTKSVGMYVVWLSPSGLGGFTGISRGCRHMFWLFSTSGSPAHNTQQWGWCSIYR